MGDIVEMFPNRYNTQRNSSWSSKRIRPIVIFIATAVVVFSNSIGVVTEAFVTSPSLYQSKGSIIIQNQEETFATTTTTSIYASSWSSKQSSSSNSLNSNALGVNKRVKAILEKAKTRTGINNINSESSSSSTKTIPSSNNNNNMYSITSTRRQSASISTSFSLDHYDYTQLDDLDDIIYNQDSTIGKAITLSNQDDRYDTNRVVDTSSSKTTFHNEVSSLDIASVSSTSPLPFILPDLTNEQLYLLSNGQRVEEQASMSREGFGYVVMDIPAPDYIIWEALLDFEAYPSNIDTVRSMRIFTNKHLKHSYVAEKPLLPETVSSGGRPTRHYGTGCITRASFVLSKFHLTIAAIHKYVPHPQGHYMEFTLDKACKNVVLQDAKGIWYTQQIENDNGPITRLWLLCELHVSSMLPQFIVDYATSKAMPKATAWIMPAVERLRKEFKLDDNNTSTGYLA